MASSSPHTRAPSRTASSSFRRVSDLLQPFPQCSHLTILHLGWANTVSFPPNKPFTPGFDPIIGQTNDDSVRTLAGTDPNNQTAELSLPTDWVLPKGGEYFFSPSIPALRTKFALAA